MDVFLNRSESRQKPSTTEMEVPWVEKYRPRKVDEVVFQNEVVSVLKKVIEGADLPNLLFYGPPGTGKTSAAIALCRQLFRNKETYQDRVLEMNASDERGINIVRHKIKEFSQRAVSSRLPDGSPVIGLKKNSRFVSYFFYLKLPDFPIGSNFHFFFPIIILDEADAMTAPAQAALRRTMEKESRTTRFFLICNYITRIIDPLTSRCAKFRFKSLSSESQKTRLEWICEQENVEFDSSAINLLIDLCGGDMRKSVTALQTVSSCRKKLVSEDMQNFLGAVPDDVVKQFFDACKSLSYDKLYSCVEAIKREGYGVYYLITQCFYICLRHEDLTDLNKATISEKIGTTGYFYINGQEYELRILDGANEFLQLLDFGMVIMEQFKLVF